MFMSHHETAGQYYNMELANRPFENAAKSKYSCMALENKNKSSWHGTMKSNSTREEIVDK
jgi:hypothetical protein